MPCLSLEYFSIKKGAWVINCARGGLVEEKALFEALKTNHIGAAAIDVFEEEPAFTNILFESQNIIFTPHLGASTIEAQEKVAIQISDQISDFLLNGSVVIL